MFSNLYRDGGRVQDGLGLLTSILLRYSEVGSVHYWREQHALKFTFMITQCQDVSCVQEILQPALEVFHQIEGQSMRIFDIACRNEENICVITISRDVDSMTQCEVGLIVELIKRRYIKQLVYEEMNMHEEELLFQEQMITQMLSSIQTHDIDENVVALREEGRVLVFKS
ncbi:MAG TPA: hypothetical protein VIM51_15320 [Desulfosporosinus sp.]